MMQYKLYIKNSSSHYLYIDVIISNIDTRELTLQLPAWRPGRYELGNFSKNIKKVDAFDAEGKPLSYKKTSKDTWVIQTQGSKQVTITYSYYASELNAGSTYVDENQMYVNPCNCLMYVPEKMQEPHYLTLEIPKNYNIATSLKKEENKLSASSYEELADSPFICAETIKTYSLTVQNTLFYLHFNGECNPEEKTLLADFSKFIEEQISFFEKVHFSEYHFLFQILPQKFHHGVEHTQNTVIAFGPAYHLMHGDVYNEFLGLCCHELFHTWNIKTIRPAEMFPYHYTKENYARTGFVYEGITTYYGDKLLLTSGVTCEETYFRSFESRLTKHLHSFGRYNLSVGDSSFDNWLDGYVPGAPYRKTNIYDEGCLIAFMLDVLIMKHSANQNNLQTVMKNLYELFYKKNKGYTEQDISDLCSAAATTDMQSFFTNYVYGLEAYEPLLHECAQYLGLALHKQASISFHEKYLGIKAIDVAHHKKVSMVAPYSPAWKAKIAINDEIIAVTNFTLKNDLDAWLRYFSEKEKKCVLTVVRNNQLLQIPISLPEEGDFFYTYCVDFNRKANLFEKENYTLWKKSAK
ncbi:MAG: M61 family metallopeptidase [Bacteroidetes bacterium]|nr:M61 family metallopeptidase [Bacteroidota bacterium]